MNITIRTLLSAFLIVIISSCTEPTVKSKSTVYTIPKQAGDASEPLKIVVIEGCEYFVCNNWQGNILCHKGNCKNPIHPEHLRK